MRKGERTMVVTTSRLHDILATVSGGRGVILSELRHFGKTGNGPKMGERHQADHTTLQGTPAATFGFEME